MAQAPRTATDDEEPPRLRRLRLMVTTLMAVLIVGVLTIAGTLVIKLGSLTSDAEPVAIPAAELALPAGEEIVALGEGEGGVLVATRDPSGAERLHKFDSTTGALLSTTAIVRNP